jgi:hypothetical protein
MHPPQAGGAAGTQTALPTTDYVLAELGALYPIVAYWDVEEAGDEQRDPASQECQAEELDEVIFAGMVAMR